MMDTSDGSPVDPKRFLTDYSTGVARIIEDLKRERQPATGERGMEGAEGMSIIDKVRRGEIVV